MRKTILLVAILLVISPSAFTQQETGNSLLDKLEKRPTTEREGNQVDFLNFGIAFGYIFGICDVFDGKEFSLPDPLNREQIFDTVEKYLNEHPEILHEAGSTLVVNALTEAFPIKSPAQPDSQNQNSVKAKEKDKKSRDKMDRCFILTGLFFNLIGVILIYPGIKPNKDGISQTLIGDGKSEVNYMPKFNYWFLGSGLICLIVGITFQIIGVLIN